MTYDEKLRIVRELLELRRLEAPLGFKGYRGVLTQRTIAKVSNTYTSLVTRMAVQMDKEAAS